MILLLLNIILILLISFVFFYFFIKNTQKKSFTKINSAFGLLSLLYLILSVISGLWLFNYLTYAPKDYFSILALLVFLQSIALFNAIYNLNRDKKIYFILLTFVPLSTYFLLGGGYILLFTSIIFSFIVFIYYSYISEKKISGKLGVIYSLTILIAYTISYFFQDLLYLLNFFSNFFFLIFIIYFLRDLESNKKDISKKDYKKKNFYIVNFIRYLIFILVLVNLLFISTLGIHEGGHLILSKISGCDYGRIIYESNMPRTEILCREGIDSSLITLGGVLIPLIVSLLLFLAGGKFIKEIALIIFGFNFLFSYQDLLDLAIPEIVAIFILLIGVAEIGIGIGLLAKSRTEEEVILFYD